MTSTKTIAVNRRARYEYDILEKYEAGLVLTGTEIKAIREGRANLSEPERFCAMVDVTLARVGGVTPLAAGGAG